MEIFCDSVCKHGIIRNGKHNMRLGNSVCNGRVNIENIAELSWALNSNLIAVFVGVTCIPWLMGFVQADQLFLSHLNVSGIMAHFALLAALGVRGGNLALFVTRKTSCEILMLVACLHRLASRTLISHSRPFSLVRLNAAA